MGDYYKALGVSRNATIDDIKVAFRKLARENHPDLNPGNKEKEEKFKDINEAYQTLSDETKRGNYNRVNQERDSALFSPKVGSEGVFNSMFDNTLFSGRSGVDRDGYFFSIPEDDIDLLAAMYKVKKEFINGRKTDQAYDTGVYVVEFDRFGNLNVKIRPEHWQNREVIKDGYMYESQQVDPKVPVDIKLLGSWNGINRPFGFDGYFKTMDSLSNKLATGENFEVTEEEHRSIVGYGLNSNIRDKFHSVRVGFNEFSNIMNQRSRNLRESRDDSYNPTMRV